MPGTERGAAAHAPQEAVGGGPWGTVQRGKLRLTGLSGLCSGRRRRWGRNSGPRGVPHGGHAGWLSASWQGAPGGSPPLFRGTQPMGCGPRRPSRDAGRWPAARPLGDRMAVPTVRSKSLRGGKSPVRTWTPRASPPVGSAEGGSTFPPWAGRGSPRHGSPDAGAPRRGSPPALRATARAAAQPLRGLLITSISFKQT